MRIAKQSEYLLPVYASAVHQDKTPPVSGTWYELLNTDLDVDLKLASLEQHNDELDAKDVDLRITRNNPSETITGSISQANYVRNTWRRDQESSGLTGSNGYVNLQDNFPMRCLDGCLVEYKLTTAAGTNQDMNIDLVYDTLENKSYRRLVGKVYTLDQDPFVQDTWYDALDLSELYGQVKEISVRQINDEAAAKTVEVEISIGGDTLTPSAALNNNTWYNIHQDFPAASSFHFNTNRYAACCRTTFNGSPEFRIRSTSVPGTNQNLDLRIIYEEGEY